MNFTPETYLNVRLFTPGEYAWEPTGDVEETESRLPDGQTLYVDLVPSGGVPVQQAMVRFNDGSVIVVSCLAEHPLDIEEIVVRLADELVASETS